MEKYYHDQVLYRSLKEDQAIFILFESSMKKRATDHLKESLRSTIMIRKNQERASNFLARHCELLSRTDSEVWEQHNKFDRPSTVSGAHRSHTGINKMTVFYSVYVSLLLLLAPKVSPVAQGVGSGAQRFHTGINNRSLSVYV